MEPRDQMALNRTRLALERTFLAYVRTTIVLLSSGFAVLKLEMLDDIAELGFVLIGIAPIFLLIGAIRFYKNKKELYKLFE